MPVSVTGPVPDIVRVLAPLITPPRVNAPVEVTIPLPARLIALDSEPLATRLSMVPRFSVIAPVTLFEPLSSRVPTVEPLPRLMLVAERLLPVWTSTVLAPLMDRELSAAVACAPSIWLVPPLVTVPVSPAAGTATGFQLPAVNQELVAAVQLGAAARAGAAATKKLADASKAVVILFMTSLFALCALVRSKNTPPFHRDSEHPSKDSRRRRQSWPALKWICCLTTVPMCGLITVPKGTPPS